MWTKGSMSVACLHSRLWLKTFTIFGNLIPVNICLRLPHSSTHPDDPETSYDGFNSLFISASSYFFTPPTPPICGLVNHFKLNTKTAHWLLFLLQNLSAACKILSFCMTPLRSAQYERIQYPVKTDSRPCCRGWMAGYLGGAGTDETWEILIPTHPPQPPLIFNICNNEIFTLPLLLLLLLYYQKVPRLWCLPLLWCWPVFWC